MLMYITMSLMWLYVGLVALVDQLQLKLLNVVRKFYYLKEHLMVEDLQHCQAVKCTWAGRVALHCNGHAGLKIVLRI
jgi:hypothetical protein